MTARSRAASSRHITGTSWHREKILHDAGTRSAAAHAHPVLPSSFKKLFGTSRENALGLPSKKQMHEAAQARKEVSPPTTRAFDNLKTDADHKHERLQACRRQLHRGDIGFPRTSARVLALLNSRSMIFFNFLFITQPSGLLSQRDFSTSASSILGESALACLLAFLLAIDIAQVRSWREGGSAQRSLALVAKVAFTMQSVLQPILPMHILYFARLIDRCARSETMP